MSDPAIVPGVIADVRAACPDVTRNDLSRLLAEHFDPGLIEAELDRVYGVTPDSYG